MSLLTQPYAVPSVVRGIVRYLLQARAQRASLDVVVANLAPEALETFTRNQTGAGREQAPDREPEGTKAVGKDRVRMTVNECRDLGLLVLDGDDLTLHPELRDGVSGEGSEEQSLPLAITRLVLAQENDGNHDLALAIAWYLGLDAYAPPAGWVEVERLLIEAGLKETLKLVDVRYYMLKYWLCYLGFAWSHGSDGRLLVPDPTKHLRSRLKELFPGPAREPLPAVMARLAALCPVFEAGRFRAQFSPGPGAGPNRLSISTSLAWLRLRDEGVVKLHHESDAPVMLLPDGDQTQAVSHVTLVRAGGRKAR